MSEVVLGILACLGALIWAEAREWLPWLAKHIVLKAVLALPSESRKRMEEELMAELLAVPGKISPVMFASSLWWGLLRESVLARLDIHLTSAALRITDLLLASLCLVLAAPLIVFVTVAMRLATGRSGLVSTRCVGKHGTSFNLLRLDFHDKTTKKPLRWGGFAYRTGIFALPAFVNVIRGEMSLVGPPPVRKRPQDCYLGRLKPGLTWNRHMSCQSVDGYGESPSATMIIYFRLLWDDIRRSFLERAPIR